MHDTRRDDRPHRAGLGVLATLGLAVALAATAPAARAADPTPAPGSTPPGAVLSSTTVFRSDAIVRQYTMHWCVPASVQTMVNLVLGGSDRSYATQKVLASRVRSYNLYTYHSAGNDVRGWAGALNWMLPDSLAVAYRDRSYGSRSAAIAAIVGAIDRTGYPVGVVVRHASHAWTVLGYRASEVPGDPASRTVLGLYVVGPLGSPSDPWPYRYMTLATFASYFTTYYEDERSVIWQGRYVIVRPEPASAGFGWTGP